MTISGTSGSYPTTHLPKTLLWCLDLQLPADSLPVLPAVGGPAKPVRLLWQRRIFTGQRHHHDNFTEVRKETEVSPGPPCQGRRRGHVSIWKYLEGPLSPFPGK